MIIIIKNLLTTLILTEQSQAMIVMTVMVLVMAAVVLHKSVHVCMLAADQKSCSKASLQATS